MAYDPTRSRWSKTISHYGDTSILMGHRVLIYSEMGFGKTTFCASFSKSPDDILFLDADYGENKVLRDKALAVRYITKADPYGTVMGLLQDCLNKRDVFDVGGPFEHLRTLAVDSWTKINELILLDICEKDDIDLTDKKPSWDQYTKLKFKQVLIMRLLKEINLTRGINIVVTALPMVEGAEDEKLTKSDKEAQAKSGFDRVVGGPNLVGGFRKVIGAEFEEVYLLETFTSAKGLQRRIWTVPHNGYAAKSRLAIPASIVDPTFDMLIELAQRGTAPGVAAVKAPPA